MNRCPRSIPISQITLDALKQEAAARGATLICSLHQVDLARANFLRLVGLKDGRIVFDAARAQVTDAMIAALCQNDAGAPDRLPEPDAAQKLGIGACF